MQTRAPRIVFLMLCWSWLLVPNAQAQLPGASDLARIGPREFILDQALLLTPEQRQEIQAVCTRLLDDKNVPIIVVTIRSIREYPERPQQIERFAQVLFDEWGIGFPTQQVNSWNRGILLLVAKNDRQARIELGADWGRDADAECASIMKEQMIPYFKVGNYAGGILAGVRGLETMSRVLNGPEGSGPVTQARRTALPPNGNDGNNDLPPRPQAPRPVPVPNAGEGGSFGGFVFLTMLAVFAMRFLLPLLSLFGYHNGSRNYGPFGGYSSGRMPGGYRGGGFPGGSGGGFSPGSGGRSSFGGGRSGGGGASGSW